VAPERTCPATSRARSTSLVNTDALLQEAPLTNGHVGPDSNALGTYVDSHC